MLIINLNTKRVNQSTIDPDIVILTGASQELITSLQKHVLSASGTAKISTNEIPVNTNRVSRTVPESTYASADSNFTENFEKLSEVIDNITNNAFEPAVKVKTTNSKPDRTLLRNKVKVKAKKNVVPAPYTRDLLTVIDDLLSNEDFVSEVRATYIDGGYYISENTILTPQNVKVALALWGYYGTCNPFSSSNGVDTIKSNIRTSQDTIIRLNSKFKILYVEGDGSSTKYSVSEEFDQIVRLVLASDEFMDLAQVLPDYKS
jgi:hypothetical protein